ncbi:MAG TPA: hypothetical protein VNU25_02265 [Candidatus Paceibacterota bacterium]|nr:hypothetical protein [Candidatus Paceibacterota bacterium]
MALPPTIPTSFVPKQPVSSSMRKQKSGLNLLLIGSSIVLAIGTLTCAGIFGYELYLKGARDAKQAELAAAQRAVDIDTVEGFIRLRDRLSATESILNQHVELSEFFDVLEARTLQTVRFSNLTVSVSGDRSAEVQMEGVARSFNALAAQSASIAAEKRIKRAIFSDIAVNENGTVGFSLTATLDPRIITSGEILPGITDEEPVAAPAAQPAAPASPLSPGPATTTAPAAAPRPATTTAP